MVVQGQNYIAFCAMNMFKKNMKRSKTVSIVVHLLINRSAFSETFRIPNVKAHKTSIKKAISSAKYYSNR